MASPHVAGAAALSTCRPTRRRRPAQVAAAIVGNATTGVVTNPGTGSPNRLLYSPPGTTTEPTPTADGHPDPAGRLRDELYRLAVERRHGDPAERHLLPVEVTGTHRGCLVGPAGTDFDLYLDKWNGAAWVSVRSGTSANPNENLSYSGTAGYYRWRVVAYSGSGTYTLGIVKP